MSEAFELTIKRTIPTSCEALFEAWLTPGALTQFMCPADGMSVPKAEVDARSEGNF